MKNDELRFAEILEYHLNVLLNQEFVGLSFNKENMGKMYQIIKRVVDEVFSKSSQNFSDAARAWIAQEYYMAIRVGDSPIQQADEDNWKHSTVLLTGKVHLKDISREEIRRLSGLFSGMTFYSKLHEELQNRIV